MLVDKGGIIELKENIYLDTKGVILRKTYCG